MLWTFLIPSNPRWPSRVRRLSVRLAQGLAASTVFLAIKHPQAAGVIVQSSFTSLPAAAREMDWFRCLPVDWMLTQRFNALAKVRSLKTSFLSVSHSTTDGPGP